MYDVFLSHNSKDKPAVEELARRLHNEVGLRPYLDKWHLVPGMPWQPALEESLEASATAAVFFGPSGVGPWHHEEVRAALARAVQQRDDYRVIPVLLPGAKREDVKGFLAQRMWVDFTVGLDDGEAFRRLVAGIKGQAPEADSFRLEDSLAPYRGLLAFDEAHARFFFGRQAEVTAVLEKLGQRPFVTVVGASGVGKSSLVLSGVLPEVRRAEEGKGAAIHVWSMRPGTNSLRALADQVATLLPVASRLKEADALEARFAAREDGLRTALDTLCAEVPARCVLVVDQLEELFTLAPEVGGLGQVEAFLRNLRDAAEKGRGRLRVLATLRADFLVRCLQSPTLTGLLQEGQVLLGSMGPAALRDVIVRPAHAVGAFLEKGVVSAILRDVVHQPGALPLLEYALDELWRARMGAWLKLSTYETSGGVWGALEKRAQGALESLPARGQEVAKRVFLRLAALGEGTEDTRRRVARGELQFAGATEEEVEEVLLRLSGPDARLLVADEKTVEVAHEVLIRQWPTLRRWLEEDRRKLHTHRRLTEAANEWVAQAKDTGFLYSGARLLVAQEALPLTSPLLNAREAEFLAVSIQAREEALQKEEERRQQALSQAQQLAQEFAARELAEKSRAEAERARAEAERVRAEEHAKKNVRLRALACGLLLAVSFLGFFWVQARRAQAVSLARELTANALLRVREDPQLSLLLIQNAHAAAFTEHVSEALVAWANEPTRAVLRGHTGAVEAASFSVDGTRVVTGGRDGTARVWDAATGKALATLSGHTGVVMAASFSADGTRVVTGSHDTTARVWDAATGKALATLWGHTGAVETASFSAEGTRVVTAGQDTTARVWDAATGKALATLWGHTGAVEAASFSADGTHVVTGSRDGTARVWDAATGNALATLSGHTNSVVAASFSADGTRVVTGSHDITARVWDAATGKALVTLWGHAGPVEATSFSSDGTRVVTASWDTTARVWDAATGNALATLSGHSGALEAASFSADGTRVVTGSQDSTARVWNAATGKALATFSGHTGHVEAASFSADGTRVVTGSWDTTARVWDAVTGKALATLSEHTNSVGAASFSTDGTRVVTGSWDTTARVWDAATGKALTTLSGHAGPVEATSFSADGRRVVTASWDTTARVWDAATGKALATLSEHTGAVMAASFSADGTRVVTGSHDTTVRVWDAATGKALATLSGHSGAVETASFSADGTRVVTGSHDTTARVWDAATGKALATLWGHTGAVETASFSAEGRRVVTASWDTTARVWDVATGKALATLSEHTGAVMAASFSADGTRVVTGSRDGTARVWDAATGNALATLSGHTNSVEAASFSTDGTRVVTASADGTARVWDAATGKALATLWGHTGAVETASFSADGTRVVTASADGTACIWRQAFWQPALMSELQAGRELTCKERQQYLHEDIDCPLPTGPSASKAAVSVERP
ncbi:TIR domain-containing protein [Myxococcus sp. CA040A]|uniref:nSTAND1 domain-containing NTPase n=1 Tax=Myxococcus sp. CA040A TaxID=2741738 RepID=UPI00157A27DE|nr:TIR domain-containing protein [Myxococcus sp. CA040A]NTX07242.1 TIR domain-containing protein [Myxococcus sp. CA040A]